MYIANLHQTNAASNSDLFVIQTTANTFSIDANDLFNVIEARLVRGPYANDVVANTSGVAVGHFYYDSSGIVHIRRT